MNKILILTVFIILFLSARQTQAQDYFKERRYEGVNFTKLYPTKYYTTISNKRYEIVNKREETLLGQKLTFNKKLRVFYVKKGKKAMRFSETIEFMKYVGNNQGAEDLIVSRKMRIGSFGLIGVGGFVILAGGLPPLLGSTYGDGITLGNTLPVGIGILMVGGGYYMKIKAQDKVNNAVRRYNKNVLKFSKPVIAANDFVPSNLGFKSVRTNLLNPTPIPALSLTWNF